MKEGKGVNEQPKSDNLPGGEVTRYIPNSNKSVFHGHGSNSEIAHEFNPNPNDIPKAVIEDSPLQVQKPLCISDSILLSQVWSRDRVKCKKLLQRIRQDGQISFDENGILWFNNQVQENMK